MLWYVSTEILYSSSFLWHLSDETDESINAENVRKNMKMVEIA